MTPDSLTQDYITDAPPVHSANGQPNSSTIRQNSDANTTSERVVGNIERYALLDALTRAEDHGTVLIDVDGHGATAIVTAVFQIPVGSLNVVDAATLLAMASGAEIVERPAGPPKKMAITKAMGILEIPEPSVLSDLNARERQVLSCICQGQTNEQIARTCHLSEASVKVFVRAALRKLGVENRTQAAMVAHKLGFGG